MHCNDPFTGQFTESVTINLVDAGPTGIKIKIILLSLQTWFEAEAKIRKQFPNITVSLVYWAENTSMESHTNTNTCLLPIKALYRPMGLIAYHQQ